MDQLLARQAGVRVLESRGYHVTDVAQGQGVPRWSRLLLKRDDIPGGKMCVVKYSTSGRISFAKDDKSQFSVLPEMDFVLHVRPVFDGSGDVRVTLFDSKVVAAAFDENVASLKKRDMGHIPSWVNPDFENGWRLVGSGFQSQALWSETIAINEGVSVSPASTPAPALDTDLSGISISEAKRRLAITFDVPVDAIEITIRG